MTVHSIEMGQTPGGNDFRSFHQHRLYSRRQSSPVQPYKPSGSGQRNKGKVIPGVRWFACSSALSPHHHHNPHRLHYMQHHSANHQHHFMNKKEKPLNTISFKQTCKSERNANKIKIIIHVICDLHDLHDLRDLRDLHDLHDIHARRRKPTGQKRDASRAQSLLPIGPDVTCCGHTPCYACTPKWKIPTRRPPHRGIRAF